MKTFTSQEVADVLRNEILSERGFCTFINGDELKFLPSEIVKIVNLFASISSQQARAALPVKQGWISVEDRLPDDLTTCLVWNKKSGGSELGHLHNGQWHNDIFMCKYLKDAVTHWMPLPPEPTK